MKNFNSMLLVLLLVAITSNAFAQDMSYQQPPKEIADLITAKPTPTVSINESGTWMLLLEREMMVPIEELAQPELGLGGVRVNPSTFGRSRERYNTAIRLKEIASLKEYEVSGMPTNAKLSSIKWSPEGKYVVFTNTTANAIELWRIDLTTKQASKITNRRLNAVVSVPFIFIDDERIIFQAVPTNIGAMPSPLAPTGVVAQETRGKAAPDMTYQDLLKTPYDELLFDYFVTSQLVVWTPQGEQPLGKAALYTGYSLSPDKQYLLVTSTHRPYSYQVPLYRFPRKVEVWDMQGALVKELVDNPLEEIRPIGYDVTSPNPRGFSWRNDAAATVYWTEALDGGTGKTKLAYIDAVFTLDAPFTGEKQPLIKTAMRFGGILWGNDKLALYSESSSATRREKSYSFNPTELTKEPQLLFDLSSDDRYADPGQPHTIRNSYGEQVLYTGKSNNELLFTGVGASPEGDMPFLNLYNLSTKTATTLWRCKAPYYENVVAIIDPMKREFITSKQSVDKPASHYLHNLSKKKVTQLTSFAHPYPQMLGVEKQQVQYLRKDGVALTAIVYTPKGYKAERDGRLPVLMWAYPREYKSANDAAQVRGSKYTFTYLNYGSPVLWVTQGFVVMDNTEMPIVGEGDKEPNDTFLEQLVMNAEAAIDKIDEMGIGDRNRVAVGGHSYGAFMTANLLAQTNLFKAGIARSGAYNRTLTPFGFQGERRTYWQIPDIYNQMSPFMYADKVKTPILLIHGDADNNTGTFTMQSERFFAALKGNGATARLVLLPYESHGYSAKENILHMLYETDTWLKKYVKDAK